MLSEKKLEKILANAKTSLAIEGLIVTDEELEKILANAKTSLAIEGLIVTDEELEIGKKFLEGKYSEEEALQIILKGVKR